jgi:DHA3 family multidrug efflux protein-like MFS transporter
MKLFYQLLVNSFITSSSTMLIWFAMTLWVYTQTHSVLATSVMSGIYLVATAATGMWFGSLVDHHKKKTMMMISSVTSLIAFSASFFMYQTFPDTAFSNHASPFLWVFVLTTFLGVIVTNIRGIVMPTLVTMLVPEEDRDKANGMVGTSMGVTFLLASVVSGFLLASSGMFWIFLGTIFFMIVAIIHIFIIKIPDDKAAAIHSHKEKDVKKFDLIKTFKVVQNIPGLLALILFTSFNNFLGGVFMPLMDPYGLSLVSLEVWGVLWGFLSLGFIFGGLFIAKKGLGNNPLRTLLRVNSVLWITCIFFTIQPSIILLAVGMLIYISLVPFIEASEHTVIQKIVPKDRQGRVFGFAQSVESAASPLTAFFIGPIAQFIFIPFMTTGKGVDWIGGWFGTGDGRGIALVFSLAGILGLIATIIAVKSKAYALLSKRYLE